MTRFLLLLIVSCLFTSASAYSVDDVFTIIVLDDATNRGVPLVELKATSGQGWFTDSNGVVAIDDPVLLGRDQVYFHVRSPGYAYAKDGFGNVGKRLAVTAGETATIKIRRTQIAERLYRTTGAGIYGHSFRAGIGVPIKHPLLNASVTGCDSVLSTIYRDKVYWFWGDTDRLQYPLGNFHTTGATSPLPGADGFLDPDKGVNFHYFENDEGFVRPMAKMPGDGPTWISGLAVLPDASGRLRMVATYEKVRSFLTIYERGLVVWNDEAERFEKHFMFPANVPAFPHGHSIKHRPKDGEGREMTYFGYDYPFFRIPNSFEAWANPATYEVFTLIDEQANRFGWRKSSEMTAPWTLSEQRKRLGKESDQGWIQLRDAIAGAEVVAHRASVNWNSYRKKWIMITTQIGGESSELGEIWYAEANHPEGPWGSAVKIVTHHHYSFYNPRHHVFMDDIGGQQIYFEGTYTTLFSKTPKEHRTPLYDYNQVMYRLDLSDSRLAATQE